MERKKIQHFLVNKEASIKEAMKVIDRGELGIVFVVDKYKALFGAVTDGDIRRAILRGIDIKKPIGNIANQNLVTITSGYTKKELMDFKVNKAILSKMPMMGSLKVPVINGQRKIEDIIVIFANEKSPLLSTKTQRKVKSVLVTGGAGYLGSVLCQKLLTLGYSVRVLDNASFGEGSLKDLLKNKHFEFQKGDIRNVSDVVHALRGIDAVVHLAAIVGDPASAKDPKETLETNYLATKNVVEACKYFQINRFVFASTCSVYGQSLTPDQLLTEHSPLNPVSLYAQTKIKCEEAILSSVDENFSPTILRMATLYGYSPNMRFDLALNLLAAKAVFDKKVTIFGGSQWRPWLHLEDASSAYITCLESPLENVRGEIFNVVSENYTMMDVGKKIVQRTPSAVMEVSNHVGDLRDYHVSFAKISSALNFRSKKAIQHGVSEIQSAIQRGVIKKYQDKKYRFHSN